MKSILTIKDLSTSHELDRDAMSAVRGGIGNQANATTQFNLQEMFAPVSVGNGSSFGPSTIIQVDSVPTQNAANDSDSSNFKSLLLGFL